MEVCEVEKQKILVVDDDLALHKTLRLILSVDYDLSFAGSAQDAMKKLYHHSVAAIVLDIKLPEISGMELLKIIRQRYPTTAVVMLTGILDHRLVVECMRAEALDYVLKGTPDFQEEIKLRLHQAIERQRLLNSHKKLEEKIVQQTRRYEIIGHSNATLKLRAKILSLRGHTSTNVLITGEPGTGKELVARMLNMQEQNKARPFIEVNCGAIPENLAESELFGHEKGAFTGALQRQEGKFVAANGGDIFLDEIGDLPLPLQVKLLRVLQERVVIPLGATKPIPINVRVIAATNKNLEEQVAQGAFREDLYERLAVFPIETPPLRERRDDIPLLVSHFLNDFGAGSFSVTKDAMQMLVNHDWHGNIRSLKNCLERAWILSKAEGRSSIHADVIQFNNAKKQQLNQEQVIPHDYCLRSTADLTPERFKGYLDWAERTYLERALDIAGNNKSYLATCLGFSRPYIHSKLKSPLQ